ncbi:helix-turn-helix domain-containing protein [Pseudomonas aeruginosa]|uniref:helix-turn-helix domain-containing protein n=1 Tax=Pseudomonas aeruginosa TaxID=287 RepID=UPI00104A2573|nr:AraC family transcriptional regulator [Pseudomonas aeruginosa]
MLGSATGHYQARTVRPSMQYFDCDLSFTEPLRTHKVLPEGLCIVQSGALGRLHEESLTLGLLVELAAYLGGADLRRARTPRAQRDLAHEARRLLEANLGEPPASLELARQLGVGETTLRRIFKNEFGRSMLQYVRDRRLEIGRQMVREGRWQIAQIAYRLGYSSPENFTHAYRARFGHPPGRE